MTVTQEEAVQDIENEWDRESPGLSVHRVLSTREKLLTVFVASLATFISPISASIFYPGVDALARNLHVSNTMINYTNTSFKVSCAVPSHRDVIALMSICRFFKESLH